MAKRNRPIPEAPSHLNKHAREEWERIAEQCVERGVLNDLNRASLAVYCQYYGRWRGAEEGLARSGLLIKKANGEVIESPLLGIANNAMDATKRTLRELRLTFPNKVK